MEDIMALVVVLAFVGAVIGMAVFFYKRHKRLKAEEERIVKERLDAIAKLRDRPIGIKVDAKGNVGIGSVPPRGKETTKTYTPSYAPSTTQSVQSYNTSSDDRSMSDLSDTINTIANVAMIAHAVRHWNDNDSNSSSSSSSSSSSDWGLDDSDSRKSISSSMSDSWSSSSSSSSDSWSSSDSGPSSDW